MPAIELLPGLRYQVKKDDFGNLELFEIKKRLFEDNIEVQNLKTGITHTILEQDIVKKLFDGELQFEVAGKNTKDPAPGKLRTEFIWPDISRLKPKLQLITLGRNFVVTEFIKRLTNTPEKEAHLVAIDRGLARLKDHLKEIIDDLSPEVQEDYRKEMALLLIKLKEVFPPPSLSAVREWKRNYILSGYDPRSLIPAFDRCGAPGKTRRSNRLDDLIRLAFKMVHFKKERGNIKHVHDELKDLIKKENDDFRLKSDKLGVPCLRSLYDWLERQHDKDILIARFGRRAAKNAYRSTGAGIKTSHPLERVEADDTPLPVFLIDDVDGLAIGKPLLTFFIDHNTGYPVGFHVGFHWPSAATVGEGLRHSIEPKTYVGSMYKTIKREWNAHGIPYSLGIDLGKGYQASLIRIACQKMGIDIIDCPVQQPHFKGRVERFFRHIAEDFLKGMPGVTFCDIFDRRDYNPQKQAVMTLDGFLEALHIFMIELYAQDWHDGVGGVPQKLWDKGIKDVPRRYPPNAAEMRMFTSYNIRRTLHHYGFELWNIIYNDTNNVELANLSSLAKKQSSDEEKKFLIKVDLWDLSKIWVYDHFNNRYICVYAVDREYTANLSYYKHRYVLQEIQKQKIEQVDQEALRQARRRLHAVIAREFTAARRMRSRKRLACLLGKSDPTYRYEEDIDYEEPIEGHTQESCTSDAFAGASDFGSRQAAKTESPAGQHDQVTQEESEVSEPAKVAADARPDTFDSVRRGVVYSHARTPQP
jgi:putative transposase